MDYYLLHTWSESRVQDVDVDTDVDLGSAHALLDLRDDAVYADSVQIPRRDGVEAATQVVPQVPFPPDQGGPNAGVDGRVQN